MQNRCKMRRQAAGAQAAALGCIFGLGTVVVLPAEAAQRDLSGVYLMKGKGAAADDSPYAGNCKLQARGNYYDVSCLNTAANHTYVGKGMLSGDQFSIVIGDMLSGDHGALYSGEYLVVYRIAPDGSMSGHWVHTLSDSHGDETLTRKN